MANQCCCDGVGGQEGLGYWIQALLAVINMTDQKHSTGAMQATARAALAEGWTPGAVITQGLQQPGCKRCKLARWMSQLFLLKSLVHCSPAARRWQVSR